jgi:hypothetical protein
LVTVPTVLASPADCHKPPPRVEGLHITSERKTG